MTQEQHAREVLLEEDDEYRDLAAQHRALESRLAELLGHAYPSDADQIEEATLKKRKAPHQGPHGAHTAAPPDAAGRRRRAPPESLADRGPRRRPAHET